MEKSNVKRLHPRNFDVHLREVARGALSALSIRIFGTILGFTVSVMIARLLGAQGSGVYYLSLSVLTIASTIGRVGFDNTIVRFVASHASVGEWHNVHRVYQVIISFVAIASLTVSALLFLSAHWMAYNLFSKPYMEAPLILVSLAIVPFSLGFIQADALRGLKQIAASQWIKTFFIPFGSIALLIPLVRWWQENGAVAAYVIATTIMAISAWLLWRRAILGVENKKSTESTKPHLVKELFQSSWPLFGIAMTALVLQQAATILLGITGSAQDVGIFNVASRIADLLLFPLMAMVSILAPKFAALHRQGQRQEIVHLAQRSSLLLTVYVIPASVIIFFGAGWVMSLFGPDFINGAVVLRILLIGVVVNVCTGAVGELLIMTGHEYSARRAIIVGAVALLITGVCLIPFFNEIGAAISVAIGYVVTNLLMVLMVWKHLRFLPLKISK